MKTQDDYYPELSGVLVTDTKYTKLCKKTCSEKNIQRQKTANGDWVWYENNMNVLNLENIGFN